MQPQAQKWKVLVLWLSCLLRALDYELIEIVHNVALDLLRNSFDVYCDDTVLSFFNAKRGIFNSSKCIIIIKNWYFQLNIKVFYHIG